MPTIVWLIVFVVLVLFEIQTLALTTIWFAGGALVGFVLSLFDIAVLTQIRVFLVVSFVLLICTRPFAIKYINRKNVKTNTESLVGKHAKVIEPISNINNTGAAIIEGLEWTARAENESMVIPVNTIVTVVRIEGVKLIVQPISNIQGGI